MTVSPSVLSERGRAIYGPTPPGQAIPCQRTTPLDADERTTVVELIAGGREGRHSVVLPEELQTRDWESVTQVALDLDERLGWDPDRLEDRRRERRDPARRGTARARPPVASTARPCSRARRRLAPELFINYRNVECEFAFRLRTALPPAGRGVHARTRSPPRSSACMPTLEIGDTVFEDWYGSSAFFGSCLDNGGGAALVCGEPIEDWRELDLPERAHRDQPERAVHQRGLRARRDGASADVADLARQLARRARPRDGRRRDRQHGHVHGTLLLRARRQRVGRLRSDRRPDRALRVMTVAVGVIGLGAMGRPMAEALATRGLPPVVVRDLGDPALAALAAAGARRAASVAALASEVDVVVLSLPDAAAVESVTLGPEGIATGGRPGLVVLDTSTIEPGRARQVAAELARRDVAYLDAPVSGGTIAAAAGSLSVMAGGDAAALARARPVARCDRLARDPPRPGRSGADREGVQPAHRARDDRARRRGADARRGERHRSGPACARRCSAGSPRAGSSSCTARGW